MKNASGYLIAILTTLVLSLGGVWLAIGTDAITEEKAKVIADERASMALQELNISTRVLISQMSALREQIVEMRGKMDKLEAELRRDRKP